jgi:RNA polymerase sigma factor (sigma-70 family)
MRPMSYAGAVEEGLDSKPGKLQAPPMAGDQEAADAKNLVSEAQALHGSLAHYFRRRVRDPAEVDDLVQEVFARILARSPGGPIENPAGYIFQTASSVLADRGRRRATRHADAHVSFDPERHAQADVDPSQILLCREDLHRATAALLTLPERTRAIFVLHRLEGQRYREIALAFDISVSAVEKHMMRAIQHLSASLEDPA